MSKGYDLEMISIPKDQFDHARWQQDIITNFEKAGVKDPERHLQQYQEAQAIAWNPKKQTMDKIFVMIVISR